MRLGKKEDIEYISSNFPQLNWEIDFHKDTLDYQQIGLKLFLFFLDLTPDALKGKNILEIGGHPLGVSYTLAKYAERKITVVNPWPAPENYDSNLVDYKQCSLEDLKEDGSFDIILGVAVTEHFLQPAEVFKKCYSLLSQNGLIALNGGPHWLSSVGHHVCYLINGSYYTFTENNPIDDYSHLYMKRWEMKQDFLQKGVPPEDASILIDFIYGASKEVNKLPTEDIIKAFMEIPWFWAGYDRIIEKPSQEIRDKILAAHPEYADKELAYSLYLYAKK